MSSPGQDYSDADLLAALKAADAAGDTAGATRLAQLLNGRQQGMSPKEAGVAAQQDPNPATRAIKMYGGAALQGAEQLVGLPGTIENVITGGFNRGMNWLTGNDPSKLPPVPSAPFSGSSIVGATNALGLTNRPDAIPLTTKERLLTGAAEGAGAGGPFGLVGAGVGALSGTASEGAHELWPDSSIAPTAAGLLTGLGIGGVANVVENALTGRSLSKAVDAAAEQLAAAKQAKEAVPTSTAAVADNIHPAQTVQEAGDWLQQAAKKWAYGEPGTGAPSVMQTKMEAAWKPVAQMVGGDAPVTMSNFDQTLKDITTSAGKLEPAAKLLRPSAPDKLQDAVGKIKDFLQMSGGGAPTWEEVSQLRTILGDARGNPKIVEEIGQQNLSNLYRAITADMRAAAKAKGSQALSAFDYANSESSRLYGIAKNQIQPIIDKSPEDAAAALLSGARKGGTDLEILRGEMPDAVNALAAAHLRTAGEKWGKLSPEGKQALVGDRGVVDQIDSILARGSQVPSAKEALATAKAAVAARNAPKASPLEGLFGAGIGADIGAIATDILGHPAHDLAGAAAGGLIGGLAPRIVAPLLQGYVRNPASLKYPALGAISGNATTNQITAGGQGR